MKNFLALHRAHQALADWFAACYLRGIQGSIESWEDSPMRFALAAVPSDQHTHRVHHLPVTVQIRPSRGVAGEHSYLTNTYALCDMLKRHTELSGLMIDNFMLQLKSGISARFPAIELNDRTLRDIGYFVD